MNHLPILDIRQFDFDANQNVFYSSNFATHLKRNHHSISVPHKHNFYLAVLFTKGTGTHEIDFNTYEVKEGSLFLLNPGQTHNWDLSDDIDGYIFFHTESFYNLPYSHKRITNFPFFSSVQNSPCMYLDKNEQRKIQLHFQLVQMEYNGNKFLKHQKICSQIDLLYIELTRIYLEGNYQKVEKSHTYSVQLQKLEQMIEENYIKEKSPSKYAEWMNITTKHLNRITKSLLDKTTSDLIIERAILESKRMLIHSDNNFTEIARELGYEDYSYFSRLFKKRCKESPSQFRKRYS